MASETPSRPSEIVSLILRECGRTLSLPPIWTSSPLHRSYLDIVVSTLPLYRRVLLNDGPDTPSPLNLSFLFQAMSAFVSFEEDNFASTVRSPLHRHWTTHVKRLRQTPSRP